MEWRIEDRQDSRHEWLRSPHQIPIGSDEVKVKEYLRFLREQYPALEFRVLKVLSW